MTERRRVVLGITGNIASGKSSVVRMLKSHGAHHIDADEVYHDLVQPGKPLLATLAKAFGDDILTADGSLDRKALGSIVFADPEKLAQLDRLTHPAVIAESDRRAAAIPHGVIVIDAVKLIESGHDAVCDEVWVVTVPENLQIARLMQRNGLSEEEARRRIDAQPPVAPKLARADRVIDNSGTLDDLRETVELVWSMLVDSDIASERKGLIRVSAEHQQDTIILDVYSDYTCPTSWAAERFLSQVKKHLGDRLQVTYRAFPLEQVNQTDPEKKVWEYPNDGTSSTMRAYQAAHAAAKQGQEAFDKMQNGLYEKRHVDGRNLAGQRVLESIAQDAGLDMDRFREDLQSDEVFAIVRDEYLKGKNEIGVFGTPTIVFDNGNAAYLKFTWDGTDEEALTFFNEFVDIVRDRPTVLEIKRPTPPSWQD